jgi:hypothetical protein
MRLQESKSGQVDMNDDDPDLLRPFILYLYSLDYPDGYYERHIREVEEQFPSSQENLNYSKTEMSPEFLAAAWTWDLDIWKMADKYNVPRLMALARNELLGKGLRGDDWPALEELPGFVAMIRRLYTCGSSVAANRLRRDVLQKHHYVAPHLGEEPLLRQLLADVPDFAYEFPQAINEKLEEMQRKNKKMARKLPKKTATEQRTFAQLLDEWTDSEDDS